MKNLIKHTTRRFNSALRSKPEHAVISTFDMFSIGIGPSSSHTVGPMRAAKKFVDSLYYNNILPNINSITCELYGSLALTGIGHGTDYAILMGLEGNTPENIDPSTISTRMNTISKTKKLNVRDEFEIDFMPLNNLKWFTEKQLPYHPNGLKLTAFNNNDDILLSYDYYSIGGGFVVRGDPDQHNAFRKISEENPNLDEYDYNLPPMLFKNWDELSRLARAHDCNISDVIRLNEQHWKNNDDIDKQLLNIWNVMEESINNGIKTKGILQTKSKRRAASVYEQLTNNNNNNPLNSISGQHEMDWLYCWAMAVNEENACGGRVVTSPTNGASGVIPSVIKYYLTFHKSPSIEGVFKMLLTASGIGMLYKRGASLSAAEVGCQGEIGVASSMAAAAITEIMGGTIEQVGNAAEIAMEHSLGLTCDPIGGYVEIPCIERNAIGAVKAINASRLALYGDGKHTVSLDAVIKTMKQTGDDMHHTYKETSLGGLAVCVPLC